MTGLGRTLIIVGLAIAFIGVLLSLAGKLPWLGKLPGDITIRKENVTVYFPLATSILASLILSFLFWLFRR